MAFTHTIEFKGGYIKLDLLPGHLLDDLAEIFGDAGDTKSATKQQRNKMWKQVDEYIHEIKIPFAHELGQVPQELGDELADAVWTRMRDVPMPWARYLEQAVTDFFFPEDDGSESDTSQSDTPPASPTEEPQD